MEPGTQKRKDNLENPLEKEEGSRLESEGKESVSGIPEVQEAREKAVEFVEGKIPEKAREEKKKAPKGGWPVRTAKDIEAIRAKLLAALPSQEVMVRQIQSKLRKDQKTYLSQWKKLRKMADREPYKFARVVALLRKIQEYFSTLAHATFEVIKQLWLKIVHGLD